MRPRLILVALLVPLALAQVSTAATETVKATESANTLQIDPATGPAAAEIESLSWLRGYWVGPGLGGECEELWMPPMSDRMHGTFTLVQEGKLVFSEAMILVEVDDTVELRVKHFDPEFVGWEEKDGYVTFPLVRLEENTAYFHGLTFRRSGDKLKIFLVLTQEGVRSEMSFDLSRVAL